jgi:hypothetical protein
MKQNKQRKTFIKLKMKKGISKDHAQSVIKHSIECAMCDQGSRTGNAWRGFFSL